MGLISLCDKKGREEAMKNTIKASVVAASLIAISTEPSHAWFFFFFPIPSFGNSSSSDPNEKCVTDKARTGLLINLDGSVYRVKSLMGRSSKCATDNFPILALTEKIAFEQRPPQVRITLSDGWQEKPLTDAMKRGSVVTYAINSQLDIGTKLSSSDARFIVDFPTYARRFYEAAVPELQDREVTTLRSTSVAGLKAYQWETSGTISGKQFTYFNTIILSKLEVALISTWTLTSNLQRNRGAMVKVANSVSGLGVSVHPKQAIEGSSIAEKKSSSPATTLSTSDATKSSNKDALSKLRDLKKMHDDGLINSDEYGAKKKQILDGM